MKSGCLKTPVHFCHIAILSKGSQTTFSCSPSTISPLTNLTMKAPFFVLLQKCTGVSKHPFLIFAPLQEHITCRYRGPLCGNFACNVCTSCAPGCTGAAATRPGRLHPSCRSAQVCKRLCYLFLNRKNVAELQVDEM